MDPLTSISTRATPQTQRAAGAEGVRQTSNAAGGYGFQLSDEALVRRFLTLGTSGGTYYASERALTQANAEIILRAARDRASWLTGEIVAISAAGRAPRQNPAIFALAAAASLGDDDGRRAALDALPMVARTGTHLFLFAGYVEQFRGWGRGLRRAVGQWYLGREPGALAYQALKYRQREGWSHRDLLRLAHPVTSEPAQREIFEWIIRGTLPAESPLISAFVAAQSATRAGEWAELAGAHGLSWEMLPDAALSEPAVWEAMISRGMPQTALMRQLPRLTRLGVLSPGSSALLAVAAQLQDGDRLQQARVHPVNVLVAQRTYASGRSARGTGQWTPVRQIVDALDAAFYLAFGAVEPAGKRTLLALDVSGSMGTAVSGLPISCREASAALALVTMATEPDTTVVGFTTASRRPATWGTLHDDVTLSELAISPRQRLDDAIRTISGLPFGGTDCSLPMTWAAKNRLLFDSFVVFTDNETWAGNIHPHQALKRYRETMVPDARLIVAGMTANDVTIADPQDPGMLDVAGFDSAVPNLIADFSRGDV
jgi:60 kDa SS-A/Ro ribonucleoprotein